MRVQIRSGHDVYHCRSPSPPDGEKGYGELGLCAVERGGWCAPRRNIWRALAKNHISTTLKNVPGSFSGPRRAHEPQVTFRAGIYRSAVVAVLPRPRRHVPSPQTCCTSALADVEGNMTATPVGTCTQAPWPQQSAKLCTKNRVFCNTPTAVVVCATKQGYVPFPIPSTRVFRFVRDMVYRCRCLSPPDGEKGYRERACCVRLGEMVQLRRPNIWCALAKSCSLNNSQECSPFRSECFVKRGEPSEPQVPEASRKA